MRCAEAPPPPRPPWAPCSARAARPTHSRSSCGSAGSRSTTLAVTASPHSGSGRPNTAASATAGWASRAASTSAGATFSPPVTIVSDWRPTISSRPSAAKRPRSPVRRTPPPATVGPSTRISPSSASGHGQAGQRPPVDRDLRARLREPVGGADGPAGRARLLEQIGRGRRAAQQDDAQARARARARVQQPPQLGRDERDDRDVVGARAPGVADHRARAVDRGAQQHHQPADVRERQRAQPALVGVEARAPRPSRARWPGRCRSSARRAAAPPWCPRCARRAPCRRRAAPAPAARRRRSAAAPSTTSVRGRQQRGLLGLPQPRVDRHRRGARQQAGVQRDREVQAGRQRDRDPAAGRGVDPRRRRAAPRRSARPRAPRAPPGRGAVPRRAAARGRSASH